MSIVPFATICDTEGCGTRSQEFARFPVCRVCMSDVCPEHIVPGSHDAESGKALCQECKAEAEQDAGELVRLGFVAELSLQWAHDFRKAVR